MARDKLNRDKLKKHLEHIHTDESFGRALLEAATKAAIKELKKGEGKESITVKDIKLEVIGDDAAGGPAMEAAGRRCYWICYTIGGERICRYVCY